MNTYGYHSSNIRPVSSVYSLDKDVSVNDNLVQTSGGLDILYIDSLSGLEDSTANNFNYLFLTKTAPVNTILKIDKTVTEFPYFRTTWIKAADEDKFLTVDVSSGATSLSSISANVGSNNIFELEFLNAHELSVRHYSNETLKFLTLNQSNSAAMTFLTRAVPNGVKDTQTFNYVLDSDTNILTLVNNLSTEKAPATRVPLMIQANVHEEDGALSGANITATDTQPYSGSNFVNQFKIRPFIQASTTYDLNDTYVTYASGIDASSIDIDKDRQINNIENNFIVHSVLNDLDLDQRSMDVNLFPLKNQVTLEGKTSKTNPYSNQETEVTHREYHKLHTGTFQKYGNDSIYTTFTTGTKEILFPSDNLTYFHVPQELAPYTKLNVNDSTLLKSGAVAGESPANSDKLFKSRKSIINQNVPSNELNGTFLCAWLSGNGNFNTTPVWVDRYFNESYSSKSAALTAGLLEPIPYISTADSLTRHLGASSNRVPIYDKLSDVAFEPGMLYAYHHIGRGNAQKVVDALNGSLLFENIQIYKDSNNVTLLPPFDDSIDPDVHIDDRELVMSGPGPSTRSIEVPLIYTFNSDAYGITDTIKNTGSFSLNFWLYASDWSKPFANQIIGNSITKGFGIFNETFVTPFTLIPDKDKLHVYNSESTYITTHNIDKHVTLMSKKGSSENFWIVDDSNDIFEYDINGVIQDKISSSHLTDHELVDIEVADKALYVLLRPLSGENCTYFKYDFLRAREAGYSGTTHETNIWNFRSGSNSTSMDNLSTSKIHVVHNGLSATEGVIVTQQDVVSGTSTDYNFLSGNYMIANGSAVDSYGKPWVLQNGVINTYSSELSSNIPGVSASQIIEGFNIDKDDNIWVLHDFNKVSKLDNDRLLLFTTTLSGILPLSATNYNRSIDFIAELTNEGYKQRPFITAQSVSGCKSFHIDHNNGTLITESILLSGEDLQVATFGTSPSAHKTYTGFDYLRKNDRNRVPRIQPKVTLTDAYNTSTTTQTYSSYTLSHDLSGLTRGWHNFCVVLDAEQGHFNLFIDSYKTSTISISGGKYSFSDVFESPLIIGAAPFYTKLLLSEHLGQPTHYLANNVKMKNIKLYDRPLTQYEIRDHYMLLRDSTNVRWDIPIGQRNYIDTVDSIFKHSVPGRRSEFVNINIRNTEIEDEALIDSIKEKVKQKLESQLPVHCKLHELGWDSTFNSLTGTVEKKSLVITEPEAESTSTTSTLTGGFVINEHLR